MVGAEQDRIRLAEAMGWRFIRPSLRGKPPNDTTAMSIPDPFTDANDDVAVNEWASKNLDPDTYFMALTEVVGSYCYLHEYRVGYFANAVLRVLGRD